MTRILILKGYRRQVLEPFSVSLWPTVCVSLEQLGHHLRWVMSVCCDLSRRSGHSFLMDHPATFIFFPPLSLFPRSLTSLECTSSTPHTSTLKRADETLMHSHSQVTDCSIVFICHTNSLSLFLSSSLSHCTLNTTHGSLFLSLFVCVHIESVAFLLSIYRSGYEIKSIKWNAFFTKVCPAFLHYLLCYWCLLSSSWLLHVSLLSVSLVHVEREKRMKVVRVCICFVLVPCKLLCHLLACLLLFLQVQVWHESIHGTFLSLCLTRLYLERVLFESKVKCKSQSDGD